MKKQTRIYSLLCSLCLTVSIFPSCQTLKAPARSNEFSSLLAKGQVIDLTHTFDAQTLYWPTETEGFRLERQFFGPTKKGYFYSSNKYKAPEHGGTHLDAPIHFNQEGKKVNELPLTQLMGEGVVVDVQNHVAQNIDYQVTKDDFLQWEKANGEIPQGAIVLLRTGLGAHWPDRKRYLGTAERGGDAVKKLHFPGLHPEGAKWLVEERNIKAVGLDTASLDYGQSQLFETHVILSKHHIPAFENVASLDRLPLRNFLVIAMPMKIGGGSGAPLRIMGIVFP